MADIYIERETDNCIFFLRQSEKGSNYAFTSPMYMKLSFQHD